MRMQKRRLLLFAAAAAFASGRIAHGLAAPRIVKVVAKRFQYMPARIEVRKGEPLVLELTSEDVFMGMNIPDFGVRSDIVPDKTTKLAFTPDKAGTFTFVCDVFCGEGHESMSGTLVVA